MMETNNLGFKARIDRAASELVAAVRAATTAGEFTSPGVAEIAARGLTRPQSLTLDEIRSVCASALTQAADHE